MWDDPYTGTKNPCGEIQLTFICSKCKGHKSISEARSVVVDDKDLFSTSHICKPCERELKIDLIIGNV